MPAFAALARRAVRASWLRKASDEMVLFLSLSKIRDRASRTDPVLAAGQDRILHERGDSLNILLGRHAATAIFATLDVPVLQKRLDERCCQLDVGGRNRPRRTPSASASAIRASVANSLRRAFSRPSFGNALASM